MTNEMHSVTFHPDGAQTLNSVEAQPSFEKLGIPGNVITHRAAWRDALQIAIDAAVIEPPDRNDKAYWEHEIKAFDRTFDKLFALIADTTSQTVSVDCVEEQPAEHSMSLAEIDTLAKAHCSAYAGPNYIVFTLEDLRDMIAALPVHPAPESKAMTDDDIQAIIKMLKRHQTFNYEPDCPVVAMCRKLENMRNGITATPQGKL